MITKIAYIAHPIGGDVEENLTDLRRIVRKINLENDHVYPFVPYYCDIVSLDDNDPVQRARGIKNDQAILKRRVIDELWLTGTHLSEGMKAEQKLAEEMGIKVVDYIGFF